MHLGQYATCRPNDSVITFNWMLGYNNVLYNDVDNKLQWDRVNYLSATVYIKYSEKNYTYIQPMTNMNEISFNYP